MLGFGFHQLPALQQTQGPEFRQQLKTLQTHRQELHTAHPLNAVPGLEGMRIADAILRERNAVGILIGGLSAAVWNKKRTPEELIKNHKDVDVLVGSRYFRPREKFEGGIDWWTFQFEKMDINTGESFLINAPVHWWQNGNDAHLQFTIDNYKMLQYMEPGLHIPGREWIADMRSHEAEASVGSTVELDDTVLQTYGNKILRDMRKTLMPDVANAFAGRIHSEKYGKNASGLPYTSPLRRDYATAINVKLHGVLTPEDIRRKEDEQTT